MHFHAVFVFSRRGEISQSIKTHTQLPWLISQLVTARPKPTRVVIECFPPTPQIPAFVGGGEILRENGLMRHLISFALVWAATTPTNSQEVVSQSSWMKVQSAVGAFNIGIKIEFYCFVVGRWWGGNVGNCREAQFFRDLAIVKCKYISCHAWIFDLRADEWRVLFVMRVNGVVFLLNE